MTLSGLRIDLKKLSNPKKAAFLLKYFKTGKGDYGEGDIFIGITVPVLRKIARKYHDLPLKDVKLLLKSKIHEERFVALENLTYRYEKGNDNLKKEIFEFYFDNIGAINNWDLVDTSAPYIVGHYLIDKDKSVLYKLAKSNNIWERRISIISSQYFIKNNKFDETIRIAEILLSDEHDLIHKAVGWMLREIGNKKINIEEKFLIKNYKKMPRTMLRYAIEKFPEKRRLQFLRGEI